MVILHLPPPSNDSNLPQPLAAQASTLTPNDTDEQIDDNAVQKEETIVTDNETSFTLLDDEIRAIVGCAPRDRSNQDIIDDGPNRLRSLERELERRCRKLEELSGECERQRQRRELKRRELEHRKSERRELEFHKLQLRELELEERELERRELELEQSELELRERARIYQRQQKDLVKLLFVEVIVCLIGIGIILVCRFFANYLSPEAIEKIEKINKLHY